MSAFLYRTVDVSGGISHILITVEPQDDHFASSTMPVDSEGNRLEAISPLAPKFYGVTEEQAHRRMVAALENSFEEVELLRIV